MILQGQPVTRTQSELTFDPRYGVAIKETWRGTKSGLTGLQAGFNLVGFKTEYTVTEGTPVLVVTLPQYNDGTPEVAQDTWEIDTEFVQLSIWRNPNIIALAVTPATLEFWREQITNALAGNVWDSANGKFVRGKFSGGTIVPDPVSTGSLTSSEAGFNVGTPLYNIYQKFLRGEEAYEERRCLIKRTRVISANYAARAIVDPIEKVYVNATLQTTFGVPNGIMNLLPSIPNASLTPVNCTWAWKMRRDTSNIIISINKLQETRDWVFAAWDRDLYTVV